MTHCSAETSRDRRVERSPRNNVVPTTNSLRRGRNRCRSRDDEGSSTSSAKVKYAIQGENEVGDIRIVVIEDGTRRGRRRFIDQGVQRQSEHSILSISENLFSSLLFTHLTRERRLALSRSVLTLSEESILICKKKKKKKQRDACCCLFSLSTGLDEKREQNKGKRENER
jgi:hypothetical protein